MGSAEGETADGKVSVATLTAMVIGSVIGAGVFLLPRRFATESGVAGAIIAWTVAGAGTFMLALVFQKLAIRKPDLDAGIYAYAEAGFGNYVGFLSAFGYWAAACAGSASYWVLIMGTMSSLFPSLFPVLRDGSTFAAVAISSVGIWLFCYLVMRGVKQAAVINRIVTVAKVIPIVVFIVIAIVAFKADVFTANFWGGDGTISWTSLFAQAKGTMLITVFVFLGIEGASVYSRLARKREDVGRATVLGFLTVLSVFVLVTLSSYGTMPQAELAAATPPSMATVLESIVGPWGSILIRVGVIVSVTGAYLAWTLIAAEMLFIPAKAQDLPRFLTRQNANRAPVNALIMSTGLVQLLLLLVLFSEDALDFILDMTASLTLVPYLFAAGYALKLTRTRETYGDGRSLWPDMLIAGAATLYTLFLIWAAGWSKLLLSLVLYLPAIVLYWRARRENGDRVFLPYEVAIYVLVTLGGIAGLYGVLSGAIVL